MEANDTRGLTPSEGRRFAFSVGGAFLALAVLFLWRGRDVLLGAAGLAAVLLFAAGLLVPTRLGPIQRGWGKLALALSRVMNPVVMGVIYYVVITPTGVLRRLLGGNALQRPLAGGSFWVPRQDGGARRDMQRQF